ncbi:hypothetical protein SDC9_87541 [bioreactor metagenome]|uniref:Uncharacterized protein n=1 Tax=bioreactor metagenome TaxID=1076179 RepID=A0A644ZJ44_9ZZZZ
MVEVVSSQVSISIGRFHLENTVTQFQDRNVERAASQVEHGNFRVLVLFVQTVSQGGCRRLVYNAAHG